MQINYLNSTTLFPLSSVCVFVYNLLEYNLYMYSTRLVKAVQMENKQSALCASFQTKRENYFGNAMDLI